MYENLQDLINDARSRGLWLRCSYQNLWFSPDELEKYNREGQFRWGIVNFTLRNPHERLDELCEDLARQHEGIETFRERMRAGGLAA